jgi:hypothetical protein
MGNVIMPTVAGLFFALAVIRYARGYPHQYIAWAGLMCLMVSGLLRGLETFASQSAWNDPDTIWITLRGLVNWTCNVFMPVYAVLQIVQGVLAYGGVGHRHYNGMPWIRHFAAAGMALALSGLLRLAEAPRASLTRTAYNLSAFSPTAQEIHDVVTAAFPRASLGWRIDAKRQAIVDSWPADVDDSAARRDWGYAPAYDFARAFSGYLIPTIRERY